MGLSVSLSNALSGMNVTQRGLEVLSRNVANQGTPGYHRQSVNITDASSNASSYARITSVDRAFDGALQRYYNQQISNSSAADVKSEFLQRIEVFLGKPGGATSMDTLYQNFEVGMEALATSPDDYSTRAQAVAAAQALASNLNSLSGSVQDLRRETENQVGNHVTDLNRMLQSLHQINNQMTSNGVDVASRASLLDQRDRLVASVSELVDTQVDYRPNGTVALLTGSGLGLLDAGPTVFEFRSAGALSASSQFSIDDAENGVGSLVAITPSGLQIDIVEQDLIQSGRISALIDLRDTTLVDMQEQLDEIASALALSMSSVETAGTAVVGPPDGFGIDLANVQPGNDFTVNYSVSGVDHNVRVVRVDDPSKLPMDSVDANGQRVIGLDFSGGIGAVATALDAALGTAITVSNPVGTTLQIVDDGVAATSDITSLTSNTTATATQGAGTALPLFLDGSSAYTNSLDGQTQKLGLASRIAINPALLANNELLVQSTAGASLGDASRAQDLLSRLQNTSFTSTTSTSAESGSYTLGGTASNMISQMMNFQGNQVISANGDASSAKLAYEAVTQRMEAEYGVNVDEEMARLMELQNAYAASARVVSIVQELIDSLMRI